MDFRIADTFTDGLARLTGEEQKAVKLTSFDLQMNPVNPGMQMHRIDRSRDKNFWSVRVSADIRIIVHRTAGSLLLCYVDHHDKAYAWAERRKLETHPNTGAAQLVELREKVQEIVVPVVVPAPQPASARPAPIVVPPKPKLFKQQSDEELLGYGVPPEWLNDVRAADEDSLLVLADHLPQEAAEALLQLATGGTPRVAKQVTVLTSPFDHPDAQRRFRVMANFEELSLALDYPWDKWSIFLHPEQRQFVERDYSGPARVSGSAGTGKTIVAVHRAAWLARQHPDARVLLATFSDTLARSLQVKVRRLVSSEPQLADRIDVGSLDAVALRLHKALVGSLKLADASTIQSLLRDAAAAVTEHRFGQSFLLAEWRHVVDAWQLRTWDAYRDVSRLGRKTRLKEPQRAVLWRIFERVWAGLAAQGLTTSASMYAGLAEKLANVRNPPYDFTIVDESQDISVSQLRFLAALGGSHANALFFAGDLGQRIFQQPFSWLSQGVDVRGRSRALRINYRTSHQIRQRADRLLDPTVTDADGVTEERGDAISVFNGPAPLIQTFATAADETRAVADWLRQLAGDGIAPHEVGVFVRSEAQIDRATNAVTGAGLAFKPLDQQVDTTSGYASIGTMHLAKGLEFRAVAVMACDDEVLPLQERIEQVGEDGDLQEVYDTERQLLYVACTRARDHLLVAAVRPASEFLEDLTGRSPTRS